MPMSEKPGPLISLNPPDSVVRKIIVYFEKQLSVMGFRLFDKNNKCVLAAGRSDQKRKEILLDEEERIVGFESRLREENAAYHFGLVIVIARRLA